MTAFELGLADYVGLQAGLHVDWRRFKIAGNEDGGGLKLTRTIPTLTIPIEVRLYALKIISFGVGGFAAIPFGTPKDTVSDGSGGQFTKDGKKRNGADFGLTGAVGVNLPIGDTLGFFAEARYNYGLTDSAANSDVEERIRDFMITAGVKVKL